MCNIYDKCYVYEMLYMYRRIISIHASEEAEDGSNLTSYEYV